MRKIVSYLLKVLAAAILFSLLWVLAYKFISPPITGMMFHKWWNQENYTIDYRWEDIEEIDSSLPLAFISSEDQKFLDHNGFDVAAIKKPLKAIKILKRLGEQVPLASK